MGKKYDKFMKDITNGKLENKWSDIMDRMEQVLKEEKMGTLDEMMFDIKTYLEKKGKEKEFINEEGVFKLPLEMVFSWFNKAVQENRKQQTN